MMIGDQGCLRPLMMLPSDHVARLSFDAEDLDRRVFQGIDVIVDCSEGSLISGLEDGTERLLLMRHTVKCLEAFCVH
jgi:hypothetical protein